MFQAFSLRKMLVCKEKTPKLALTCVGPGIHDKTLSMFSEVTSTSSTATRASPTENMTK